MPYIMVIAHTVQV